MANEIAIASIEATINASWVGFAGAILAAVIGLVAVVLSVYRVADRWAETKKEETKAHKEVELKRIDVEAKKADSDLAPTMREITERSGASDTIEGFISQPRDAINISTSEGTEAGSPTKTVDDNIADIRKRAEAGDAEAQYNLGNMYYTGEGIAQNIKQALDWWNKAAESGVAAAQFNIAVMYYTGAGVEQDKEEAVRWCKKSAKAGLAEAQFNLGTMHRDGEVVKQDKEEAVRLFEQAAEGGLAGAQYTLGIAYFTGEGVDQDTEKAAYWWSKAAKAGNTKAQSNLGLMYAKGDGVVQNYFRAYFWFLIASAQGDGNASINRDVVVQHLSPEERGRVQGLATRCIESDYKDCVEP